MKICTKCGKEKQLTEFYKDKNNVDGHRGECRECSLLSKKNYYSSEAGVIKTIYDSQIASSKRRGHIAPCYSRKELAEWLYANDFKQLFDAWVSGGMTKDLKPSCDRLDDFKSYSLDNIRLVTWRENHEKLVQDIKTGKGTAGKRCKPVLQFDANDNQIAEYISFSEARRALGYSMERPLRSGKPDRTKGFIWRYKDE